MKYLTTDKHPELKEGIEVIKHTISLLGATEYKTSEGYGIFTIPEFKHDLDKGYIKELQEPEFTKDDMIDFANDFISNYKVMDGKEQLEIYLKQRNK